MAYLCTECKRKHHSGKIFNDHKRFKKVKPNEIPFNKLLDFDYNILPAIAQRQIVIYARKMAWDRKKNGCNQRQMYIQQINKVILRYDTETPILL